MSEECGVCLSGYEPDGCNEFSDVSFPKARKEHRCCECARKIEVGQKYQRFSGKFDGDLFSLKSCMDCSEIRDAFTCLETSEYPCWEMLWEDMAENVFPVLTTACFAKVKTESAREYLRLRWMQWKGLNTA